MQRDEGLWDSPVAAIKVGSAPISEGWPMVEKTACMIVEVREGFSGLPPVLMPVPIRPVAA